ncbi:MAG: DNA repair protein RecO [Bacteroidota bacterium]
MLIKTRGIVLKTKKYSETSIIADIYTEEKGLRSYIISGVRSKRSRVSAGLLQIMTPVEIVAYHREGKSLTRLKEIKPYYVFQSIPFEVARSAVGMFMVEIAQKAIHAEESQPLLFEFLLENFVHLDETPHSFANLHLHYMANLTEHLGFLPSDVYTEETPVFDLKEGGFMPFNPAHPHWLRPELGAKLSQLLQLPKEQSHTVLFSREERKSLLRSLIDYYRLHIEHFPVIHSFEILEEVLG